MLPSSKNSDVGIGARSGENKWFRSNSSEPIMLRVLSNTTSMSVNSSEYRYSNVNPYNGYIHGDPIATYFIIETLR